MTDSISTAVNIPKVNLDRLKTEVERNFTRNRVSQLRRCDGRQNVIFHAPYLAPVVYPPWLPRWLHWSWHPWWQLREPWLVRYPHQWFWDSAAHAIALSHFAPDLARAEVCSLLSAQDDQGFIPHMIWNPKRLHWVDRMAKLFSSKGCGSPCLQPPLLAQAVERIYQKTGDLDFVKQVLPALKKYYLYIDRVRVRGDDGLPEIVTSYESGKDRSREYDVIYGEGNTVPPWRGPMIKLAIKYWLQGWDIERIFDSNRFRVKDLLFNCIYAQNLFSLYRLCLLEGISDDAALFRNKAEQAERSILNKMYDPETGLFFSLDSRHNRDEQIKVNTVSSLMPLTLDTIDKARVEKLVAGHLLNPAEFWTPFPLPTEPAVHPHEKTTGHSIWRGCQTWVITNWLIVIGLRKQAARFAEHSEEYNRIADHITFRTYQLVNEHGFREYYDSYTGEGRDAHDFGMATLVLDMVDQPFLPYSRT